MRYARFARYDRGSARYDRGNVLYVGGGTPLLNNTYHSGLFAGLQSSHAVLKAKELCPIQASPLQEGLEVQSKCLLQAFNFRHYVQLVI